MKKFLIATTALAAAGMLAFPASDANAQAKKAEKLKLSLSGAFTTKFGFGSNDGAFERTQAVGSKTGNGNFNVWNDSEIRFNGTTKLDNGIAVSVKIEFETDKVNSAKPIDNTNIKFVGGFGDLRVGQVDGAVQTLATFAPNVGVLNIKGSDFSKFISTAGISSGSLDTRPGGGKGMTITYFTPAFNGLQAGVSYVVSDANTDGPPVSGDTNHQDASIKFGNKVGDVSVTADVGWWKRDNGNSVHGVRGGLKLGLAGFNVGGSYGKVTDSDTRNDTSGTVQDTKTWEVGIDYGSGPWSVSATYLRGEATASTAATARAKDETTKFAFGAKFAFGPGLTAQATIAHADNNGELTVASDNNDGWAIVGAIGVSF